MTRIRIKRLPKAAFGGQSGFGLNLNSSGINIPENPDVGTKPNMVNNYLREVPRAFANVEAEQGETALGDFDNDGMLEHLKVGGRRHSEGGTNLSVPSGTFIFSDTKKMRIKDKAVLSMFSKTVPLTPAAIAKSYDLNKYKAILENPDSDNYSKKTAEMMLANNTGKLKQLALVQEGMKGFPQGIPQVAGNARYGGYVPTAGNGMQLPGNSSATWKQDEPDEETTKSIEAEHNRRKEEAPLFEIAPHEAEDRETLTPDNAYSWGNMQNNPSANLPVQQPVQFVRSKVPFSYMMPDMRNILDRALDIANTHKYLPWSAPFHATTPETVFYDPSREIAALQGNHNARLLAAAMTGNPKTFRAIASATTGADDVANVIGKYNNLNAGQADKAAQVTAEIANNARMYESRRKTEDHRNTAIADQQYDNAMKQGYGAYTQAMNQAWNNRMMLNKVNNNSQHYYTDPVTGKTILKSGIDLETMPPAHDTSDMSEQMLKEIDALGKKYPNINSSTLYQLVRQKYGLGTISTANKVTGVRTRSSGYLANPSLYPNGQIPYPQGSGYAEDFSE